MSIYIYNILGVCLSSRPPWGKGVRVSRPFINAFINAFPWLPFPQNDLFTYLPPFNTTTLIKPMNEKEEETPLEDPCVRRNCLAWERHIAQSKEQHATDASRQAAQRGARNDAQIATKKPSFEAACISEMAPQEATFMTCNCLK